MTKQSITCKDYTIAELFSGDSHFFKIPPYQRAYEWRAFDEVDDLWEDLVEHHQEWLASNKESQYLLGQLLVHGPDGALEVSDGQQRLTTLYLLIGTLASRLEELKELGPSGELANWAGWLRDMLCSKRMSEGKLQMFSRLVDQKESGTAALLEVAEGKVPQAAEPELRTLVAAENHLRHKVTNLVAEEIVSFIQCITTSIKLVLTRCSDSTTGVRIFTKLNDRGRPVDIADRLKAYLYEKADFQGRIALVAHWQQAQKSVRDSKTPRMDSFITYFLLGKYVGRSKVEDILKIIRQDSNLDPVSFSGEIAEASRSYRRILDGFYPDSESDICVPLANIASVPALARFRQHLPLLLALRNLPRQTMLELTGELEATAFVYNLTKEGPPNFFLLMKKLLPLVENVLAGEDDAWVELLKILQVKRDSLADTFRSEFLVSSQSSLLDKGVRYVLGKLEQHIAQTTLSLEGVCPRVPAMSLSGQGATDLEHITPQSSGAKYAHGFFGEDWATFVGHIGNLTLLEPALNRACGYSDYFSKIPYYKQSSIFLTRSLVKDLSPGGNNGYTRAGKTLEQFLIWNAETVLKRAEMLYKIAASVWKVKEVEGPIPSARDGVIFAGEIKSHQTAPQLPPRHLKTVVDALAGGITAEQDLAYIAGVQRGDYVTSGAEIAGLAEETDENFWQLTDLGWQVANLPDSEKSKRIAEILHGALFISQWRNSNSEERKAILRAGGYNGATIIRRSSELNSWLNWIDEQLTNAS